MGRHKFFNYIQGEIKMMDTDNIVRVNIKRSSKAMKSKPWLYYSVDYYNIIRYP